MPKNFSLFFKMLRIRGDKAKRDDLHEALVIALGRCSRAGALRRHGGFSQRAGAVAAGVADA